MPLVRISLLQDTTPAYRKALGDGVHRAMVEALGVPPDDKFQVITEHAPGDMVYDPKYCVHHSDHIVFVQITLSVGRKAMQKTKFYKRAAELLQESPGLKPADLIINLVEVAWENWSFGNGETHCTDQ